MIRSGLRLAALLLWLAACVPLHYGTRLLRLRSPWPRRFLKGAGWIMGLRVRTLGSFRRDHVLFVANHATWLDILAIGGATGAAFVAKSEVADHPFIKWLADLNDTVYVQRQDRRAVHGQVDGVRAPLMTGRAVCIFPEGTTKGGQDILPFRASLLSSLFPPVKDIVVQPIALDYREAAEELAWGAESGLANAKRILARRGTIPLTLRFLAPLTPGADGDRKAIAAKAREEIVAALNPDPAAGERPRLGV